MAADRAAVNRSTSLLFICGWIEMILVQMPSWALEMSTQGARASSLLRPPQTHEMQSIQCLELVCCPLFTVQSIPLSSRPVMAAHTPTASSFSAAPGLSSHGSRDQRELQGVNREGNMVQIQHGTVVGAGILLLWLDLDTAGKLLLSPY